MKKVPIGPILALLLVAVVAGIVVALLVHFSPRLPEEPRRWAMHAVTYRAEQEGRQIKMMPVKCEAAIAAAEIFIMKLPGRPHDPAIYNCPVADLNQIVGRDSFVILRRDSKAFFAVVWAEYAQDCSDCIRVNVGQRVAFIDSN